MNCPQLSCIKTQARSSKRDGLHVKENRLGEASAFTMRNPSRGLGAAGSGIAICTAIAAETSREEAVPMPLKHSLAKDSRQGWGRRAAFSVVAACCCWSVVSYSLLNRRAVSATPVEINTPATVDGLHTGSVTAGNVTPNETKQHAERTAGGTAFTIDEVTAADIATVPDGTAAGDTAADVTLMTEDATDISAHEKRFEGAEVEAPETLANVASKADTAEQSEQETLSAVSPVSYPDEITPEEGRYESSARRLQTSAEGGEEEEDLEQQKRSTSRKAEDTEAHPIREQEQHLHQGDVTQQKVDQQEPGQQREKDEEKVEAKRKLEKVAVQQPPQKKDGIGVEVASRNREKGEQKESSTNSDREAALTFVQDQLQQLEQLLKQHLKTRSRPAIFKSREDNSFDNLGLEDSSSGDLEYFTLPSTRHPDLEPLIVPITRSRPNIVATLTRPLRNTIRFHKRRSRNGGEKKRLPQQREGDEDDPYPVYFPEENDSAAEAPEEDAGTRVAYAEEDKQDGWQRGQTPYPGGAREAQKISTHQPVAKQQVLFQNKKQRPLFSGFRHRWETRAAPKLKPIGEKMVTLVQQLLDRLIPTPQPHSYVVVQPQPQRDQQNWTPGAVVTKDLVRNPEDKGRVYNAFFAGAEAAFAAASESGNGGKHGGITMERTETDRRTAAASETHERAVSSAEGETATEEATAPAARDSKADSGAKKSGHESRRLSEPTTSLDTADPVAALSVFSTSTAAGDAAGDQKTSTESREAFPLPMHSTEDEHLYDSTGSSPARSGEVDLRAGEEQQEPHRRLAAYGLNRPPTPMPTQDVEYFPFRGWRVRRAREKLAPIVHQRTWGHPRKDTDWEEDREFSDLAAEADINEDEEEDDSAAEDEGTISENNRQGKDSDFRRKCVKLSKLNEVKDHDSSSRWELNGGVEVVEEPPTYDSKDVFYDVRDGSPEKNGNTNSSNSVTSSNVVRRRLATAPNTPRPDKWRSQQEDVICNSDGKLASGYPCSGVPHYLPPGVDEEMHLKQLELIDQFLERTFGGLPDFFMDDLRRNVDEDSDKEEVEQQSAGRRSRKSRREETSDEAVKRGDAAHLSKSTERATREASKTATTDAAKQAQSDFQRPPTPMPVGYGTFFPSRGEGPRRMREDQRLPRIREARMWDGPYEENSVEMDIGVSEPATEFAETREPDEVGTYAEEFGETSAFPSRTQKKKDFETNANGGKYAERDRIRPRANGPRRRSKSTYPFTDGAAFAGVDKLPHEGSPEDMRTTSPRSSNCRKMKSSRGIVVRRLQAASPSGRFETKDVFRESSHQVTSGEPCSGGPESLSPPLDGEQFPQPELSAEALALGDEGEPASSLDDVRGMVGEGEKKTIAHFQEKSSKSGKPEATSAVYLSTVPQSSPSREAVAKGTAKPAAGPIRQEQSVLERRPTPYPRRIRRVPGLARQQTRQFIEGLAEEEMSWNHYPYEEPALEANMEVDEEGGVGWAEYDAEELQTEQDAQMKTTKNHRRRTKEDTKPEVNRRKRTILKALRWLVSLSRMGGKREFALSQQPNVANLSHHGAADDNQASNRNITSINNNRINNDAGVSNDFSSVPRGNRRRLREETVGPVKETRTRKMLIPGSRDSRGRPLVDTCVRCEKVVLCLVLFPGLHTIESCSLMYLPEGIDNPYAVFNSKCSPCSAWGTDRPLPSVLSSRRYVRFLEPPSILAYSESGNRTADAYTHIDEVASTTPSLQASADDAANPSQFVLPSGGRETVDDIEEDAQLPEAVSLPHAGEEEMAATMGQEKTAEASVNEETPADEEALMSKQHLVEAAESETPEEVAPVERTIEGEESAAIAAIEEQAPFFHQPAEPAESGAPRRRLTDGDLHIEVEKLEESSADGNITGQETEQGQEEEGDQEEEDETEKDEGSVTIGQATEQLQQYSSNEEQQQQLGEHQQQSLMKEQHHDQTAKPEQQVMQQRQLGESHPPEAEEQQQQQSEEQAVGHTSEKYDSTKMHEDFEEEELKNPPRLLQAVTAQENTLEELQNLPVCPCRLRAASQQQRLHGSPENITGAKDVTAAAKEGIVDTGFGGTIENGDMQQPKTPQQVEITTQQADEIREESASTLSDGRFCHCCPPGGPKKQKMALEEEWDGGECPRIERDGSSIMEESTKEENLIHVPVVLQQIRDHPWMTRALIGLAAILGGDLSLVSEMERRKKDMSISSLAPAFLLRRPQLRLSIAARRKQHHHQIQQTNGKSQNRQCKCNALTASIGNQQEGTWRQTTQSGTASESNEKTLAGQIHPQRIRLLQAQNHPTLSSFWEAMAGLLLAVDEEQIAQLRKDRGLEEEKDWTTISEYAVPTAFSEGQRRQEQTQPETGEEMATTEPPAYVVGVHRTTAGGESRGTNSPLTETDGAATSSSDFCCQFRRMMTMPRAFLSGRRYLYAVKSRNPFHVFADEQQQKQLKDRIARNYRSMSNFWEGVAALLKGGAVEEVKTVRRKRGIM